MPTVLSTAIWCVLEHVSIIFCLKKILKNIHFLYNNNDNVVAIQFSLKFFHQYPLFIQEIVMYIKASQLLWGLGAYYPDFLCVRRCHFVNFYLLCKNNENL